MISAFIIVLTIIPIVRDVKIFKYGQVGKGSVVNVSSYFDMSKKALRKNLCKIKNCDKNVMMEWLKN